MNKLCFQSLEQQSQLNISLDELKPIVRVLKRQGIEAKLNHRGINCNNWPNRAAVCKELVRISHDLAMNRFYQESVLVAREIPLEGRTFNNLWETFKALKDAKQYDWAFKLAKAFNPLEREFAFKKICHDLTRDHTERTVKK